VKVNLSFTILVKLFASIGIVAEGAARPLLGEINVSSSADSVLADAAI